MLAERDINRIRSEFQLFDHNWRFYSSFLGEPFLVGDLLTYFDGAILYVCGFPLGDCLRTISQAEIERVLREREFRGVSMVDIWGRLPDSLDLVRPFDGEPMQRVQFEEYAPNICDLAIPITSFSFDTHPKARLRRNSGRNRNIEVTVTKRDRLTFEHMHLISGWFAQHDVSMPHASMALSTAAYVGDPDVSVFEAYLEGTLRGFAVVAFAAEAHAIVVQGFYDNIRGGRVADAVMSKMIEESTARGVLWLHLGYSMTEGLRQFKRDWGATWEGPSFREVFYSISQEFTELIRSGNFIWHERLSAGTLRRTAGTNHGRR
jgi:hypothetical protein